MPIHKLLQQLQIRLAEIDVPRQQPAYTILTERKRSYALIQNTNGYGRVIAYIGALLNDVAITTGDPAHADTGERVCFAHAAGGDCVGVAE